MTVSLYSDEYVERLEQDRDELIATMLTIENQSDARIAWVLSTVQEDLPPRRGAGKIQDTPR